MNYGYLYCIFSKNGKKNKYFNNEFLVSYASLKKYVPDASVSVYTNIKFDNIYGIDHIIFDENIDKRLICKANGLLKTPYDRTILLDTDIIIHRSVIDELFLVLDEFDFTCCYGNAPPTMGELYPDLNTGLIGVKNNEFTREQINIWISTYKGGNDQVTFRNNVFMKNKNKFHILPTYFMFRWHHYRSYIDQAVLTHSHNMSKDVVKNEIINSWNDKKELNEMNMKKLDEYRSQLFSLINLKNIKNTKFPEILLIDNFNQNLNNKNYEKIDRINEVEDFIKSNYENTIKCINLNNESLEEFIYYFNNCKLIICSRGFIFSNLFFCNKNTVIIEITNNNNETFFDKITKKLQLIHYKCTKNNYESIINIIKFIYKQKLKLK